MKQRTAMLAGALVLAMVAAGVALATGVTGPPEAAARVSEGRHAGPSIVRTVSLTETMHRHAGGPDASGGSLASANTTAPSSTSGTDDDPLEVERESEREAEHEPEQETEPLEQEHEDD